MLFISINIVAIILFIAFIITLLFIKRVDVSQLRHKRNIRSAQKILETFEQFPETAKVPKVLTYLKKIDPYVFEELLLTAFEKQGYKIERGKTYSNDGGIDGKMFKDGKQYYIQAKRYAGYVKKQHIQDFIEATGNQVNGLFIHTGRTGKELFKIIPQNVQIISGHNLVKLLEP